MSPVSRGPATPLGPRKRAAAPVPSVLPRAPAAPANVFTIPAGVILRMVPSLASATLVIATNAWRTLPRSDNNADQARRQLAGTPLAVRKLTPAAYSIPDSRHCAFRAAMIYPVGLQIPYVFVTYRLVICPRGASHGTKQCSDRIKQEVESLPNDLLAQRHP